jgi:hypothetical protein
MTHAPPFHRRILLLVFIVMFFAVAPAAIFYTAGYRWNPKKGAIERNGTLIVDTIPAGAAITLNGNKLLKASPVTQQDVAPGSYRIRLEMQGYYPWEKTLDVRPELVTFVTGVVLWPMSDAAPVESVNSGAVRVSPNERFVAYVRERNGSRGVTIREISNGNQSEFSFSTSTFAGAGVLRWDSASTAVYAEDDGGNSWVIRRTKGDVVALPKGAYRWSGNELIGIVGEARYVYDVARGTTTRTALAAGVVDEEGGYDILFDATSSDSVLRDTSEPNKRYQLPRGDWSFMASPDNVIALTNGASGFVFRDGRDPTAGSIIPENGELFSIRTNGEDQMLAVRDNELWLLVQDAEPELLVRKSIPIVGASWHRLGADLLYATNRDVIALNLDARDGRMETALAHFDDIFGISYSRKELFVSGRKGDESGIWTLRIER